MSLVDLVRAGSYANAQAAFVAITTPVETRNFKAWTVADIVPIFPDDINTILGTLKAVPVFESAFIALSISGLELASDGRQAFIDQVATVGQWPDELKTRVKQLGRPMLAPWQSAGLNEPTIADIEKVFVVEQTRQKMAQTVNEIVSPVLAKSTAVNAWLDSIDVSTKTLEELQAYCDALLASDSGNP